MSPNPIHLPVKYHQHVYWQLVRDLPRIFTPSLEFWTINFSVFFLFTVSALILSQLKITSFGLFNISLALPIVSAIKIHHIDFRLVDVHGLYHGLINPDHILKKIQLLFEKTTGIDPNLDKDRTVTLKENPR